MLNKWWEYETDCLRCNRTGLVPVMDFKSIIGKGVQFRERMFLCGCKFTKKYPSIENKKIEIDGKFKWIEKEVFLGVHFDDVFSETQFPFSLEVLEHPKICNRVNRVDYYIVYMVCMYYCIEAFNLTKQPLIESPKWLIA